MTRQHVRKFLTMPLFWSFTGGGSMRRKFAGGNTGPDHYQ